MDLSETYKNDKVNAILSLKIVDKLYIVECECFDMPPVMGANMFFSYVSVNGEYKNLMCNTIEENSNPHTYLREFKTVNGNLIVKDKIIGLYASYKYLFTAKAFGVYLGALILSYNFKHKCVDFIRIIGFETNNHDTFKQYYGKYFKAQ